MNTSQNDMPDVPTITPEEAYEELKSGNPTLLDVRPSEDFDKGHIKGATSMPIDTLAGRADKELCDKDERILVYCRSGHQAADAVDFLTNLGYANVTSLGGIEGWPYEVVE